MASTRMRMDARQQKRRLLFLLFIICLAAAVYFSSSLFVVREIEVEGLQTLDSAQVFVNPAWNWAEVFFAWTRKRFARIWPGWGWWNFMGWKPGFRIPWCFR